MLEGEELSVKRVLELMQYLKYEKDMYNALNILYFSCDDVGGEVEEMYNQIIDQWKNT